MLNYLKEILRGVFIGIANIIPGVSGGTIALSMGVYEKIISAVNNVRKDFKNSVKTLFPYVIGAVIGIVVLSFVIEYSLKNYELPTLMAFVSSRNLNLSSFISSRYLYLNTTKYLSFSIFLTRPSILEKY